MNRALLAVLLGLLSLPVFWWLLGEMFALCEMWQTQTTTRTGLVDDYGLGILLVFLAGPLSVLASVSLTIWLLFRWQEKDAACSLPEC